MAKKSGRNLLNDDGAVDERRDGKHAGDRKNVSLASGELDACWLFRDYIQRARFGQGGLRQGLTDGYYRMCSSDVMRLERSAQGDYLVYSWKLEGMFRAHRVRSGLWMLQYSKPDSGGPFLYFLLHSEESGSSHLAGIVRECTPEVMASFSKLPGYVEKCHFGKPSASALAAAIADLMPDLRLDSEDNENTFSTAVRVERLVRIPDRAGRLLLQQAEINEREAKERR